MHGVTSEGTGDPSEASGAELAFRAPTADDAPRIAKLVADCPPLDRNSVYCNLLQCTDFADTCVLAELGGRPLGWLSGYLPPDDDAALFIWQVAVHQEARGLGLAKAMILDLLGRPACASVERIKTTITPDNEASWSLFESVASALDAPIRRQPWFDEETHFRGRHDSEHLVTIGEIPKANGASDLPIAPV